jgi:RNA polymerase sigma-70 factor (ECF subfamily)
MVGSAEERLSRISTVWTLVRQAHGSAGGDADAKVVLMDHYQGAVYRYLCGSVRDLDAADDLFQEFALRLVRGAFRNAHPERGRFRDFLKRSLMNLVTDYRKGTYRRPKQIENAFEEPAVEPDGVESDELFLASWRDELMAHAWAGLAEIQDSGGPPLFSVLHFRAAHPQATSQEIAQKLNDELNPRHSFTDQGTRKLLQRARDKFSDLLLNEVIRSLDAPSWDELEKELIDLGLLSYCRSALDRHRTNPARLAAVGIAP